MKQTETELFLESITNIAYFNTDLDRKIINWNKTCEILFGYKREDAIGQKLEDLIIPDYLAEQFVKDFLQKKAFYGEELEYKDSEHSTKILYTNTLFIQDRYYSICIDPKLFKNTNQLQNAITQSNSHLKDEVKLILISLDRNGYIEDFNHFAQTLTGYKKEDVLGRSFVELFLPPSYREKTLYQIQKSFASKQILMQNDFPLICRSGNKIIVHWDRSLISNQKEKTTSLLLMGDQKAFDNSIQDRLEYLANYDSLTDLPNKNLLYDRLYNAINKSARHVHNMITIFLNLDNFKSINHTLGYAKGDELLKEVAIRLQSELRDYDTIARFSGDEFVILFENINNELDAGIVAERISNLFEKPFSVHSSDLMINVNMGISFFPSDGNDPKTLIKNANMAMLRAKESKNSNFHFFKAQIHEEISHRMKLESNLRKAIENREFFVEYQPLVDAKTEKIIGAEALVRWNHPDLKIIPPLDFIPIAEDTGMILEIGEIVLFTAINQMQKWHNKGFKDLTISINISGVQLLQSDLEKTIDIIINDSGFNPRYLELELTESILMQNIDLASKLLHVFKDKGMHIAIDDFGTGYSSLSYLKKLPIDSIKIDQSFIHNIETDQSDKIIVDTVIAMGHSLGFDVIAEGIENKYQKNYLQTHNCNILQGYYFGKSLDCDTFEALLKGELSICNTDDHEQESEFEFEQTLKKYSKPFKFSS